MYLKNIFTEIKAVFFFQIFFFQKGGNFSTPSNLGVGTFPGGNFLDRNLSGCELFRDSYHLQFIYEVQSYNNGTTEK